MRPTVLMLADSTDGAGDSLDWEGVEEVEGNSDSTSNLGDWGRRLGKIEDRVQRVGKVEEVEEVGNPSEGVSVIVHICDDCPSTFSSEYVLDAYLKENGHGLKDQVEVVGPVCLPGPPSPIGRGHPYLCV